MNDDSEDVIPPEVAAKLLRSEYPDDMAQASCTCEPEAMCGAHRLLKRYGELYERMVADHAARKAAAAEVESLRVRLQVLDDCARALRGTGMPGEVERDYEQMPAEIERLWSDHHDTIDENSALRTRLQQAEAAKELVCEALNDLFHVLISEFDYDPVEKWVGDYLSWTAEKQIALRHIVSLPRVDAEGSQP